MLPIESNKGHYAMPQAAITEFQKQIESVRREAFAAGYANAMDEVMELTARATPESGYAAVPSGNGRGRGPRRTGTRQSAPISLPLRRRKSRANGPIAGDRARTRRSAGRRSQRGTNAVLVSEGLKTAAPRALRQADIRRALEDKGKTISFPSIGYSLRQLAARKAAKQGSGKTWRYQKT